MILSLGLRSLGFDSRCPPLNIKGSVDLVYRLSPSFNGACNEITMCCHYTRCKEPKTRRKKAQTTDLKDDIQRKISRNGNNQKEYTQENPMSNPSINKG